MGRKSSYQRIRDTEVAKGLMRVSVRVGGGEGEGEGEGTGGEVGGGGRENWKDRRTRQTKWSPWIYLQHGTILDDDKVQNVAL